jgi:hypothetical protein
MRKMILSFVFLMSLQVSAQSLDQMKSTFEYGRAQAQQTVAALQDCQIDNSTLSANLKQWLKSARLTLAQDILASPHNWNVGNYQECAYTQTVSRSPVELSLPVCSSVAGQVSSAAQVLLQQSLIHLGMTEYTQVQSLKQFIFAAPQISCNPPGSVWDPAICPGHEMTLEEKRRYFQPGQTNQQAGEHSYYIRTRACTRQTGCGEWFVPPTVECIYGGNVTSCSGHPLYLQTYSQGISAYVYNSNYNRGVSYIRIKIGPSYYTTSTMGDSMNIKTSCAYGKLAGEMDISSTSGSYYNYEMVLYGTH